MGQQTKKNGQTIAKTRSNKIAVGEVEVMRFIGTIMAPMLERVFGTMVAITFSIDWLLMVIDTILHVTQRSTNVILLHV
jgi:hypothetical protein